MKWSMKRLKAQALISILLYSVCIECNNRIFDHVVKTPSQVLESIREVIRYKRASLRQVAVDYVNTILCRNWGLYETILM